MRLARRALEKRKANIRKGNWRKSLQDRGLRGGIGIALGQFKGDFAHLFMDETVGGEDDWSAEGVGSVVKIGDFSAGLFDEEDTCSSVPAL